MIAATQIQILQSLFQHALQFIPEQSDPVDFFEMYFDETQIKKANGEIYSSGIKSNGINFQNQSDNTEHQVQFSALGKTQMSNSKSVQQFGSNDQNHFNQGNIKNKNDLSGIQQQQQNNNNSNNNGYIKKISMKKPIGSISSQNFNINQFEKEARQPQKTKLSPIRQAKIQITKINNKNDPFNQHKDGFFHPTTAQSTLSGPFQRINNNAIPSQNNTHYNQISNSFSNKNLRSNSNANQHDNNLNGGPSNYHHNKIQYNAYNLDSSHNQNTENQGHNSYQYSVYDPGFKYNPNPYAAGWANAILKEHYKVALRRIDEKNGRKRWIIRKVKMQKDGLDHQSSVINPQDGKGSRVVAIQQNGFIKPENKLKKQMKKNEDIEGVNDLFTNAFVQKQRQLINQQHTELLDFSELVETLSFDREYIAYNILNQPFNEKLKTVNEEEFEENLQPYFEYVSQNFFVFPIYHINFKSNLEKTIFLNKLLIGNL